MATSNLLDDTISAMLSNYATQLEGVFQADVMSYMGPIHESLLNEFRNFVEGLALPSKNKRLAVLIKTGGGTVQAAEKMVEIMRHHYKEVFFVVPDLAMSAGTVLVMSGDKVFMDYSSSLGPIDPQVPVTTDTGQQQYFPALGHLDKVEELIQKSLDNTISPAEFALLRGQNLALLRSYEQARDLSIALLKKWLVEYKFRSWKTHRTDPDKKDKPVTKGDKEERAQQIADLLCNNKVWHSHGRLIGVNTLRDLVRLEIDDYSANDQIRNPIRQYHDTLSEYVNRMSMVYCFHSAARSTL
jgi:ATP-dependent protease ClpP protease subunit